MPNPPPTLKDLFETFQRSAFRVEALPEYRVPEEESALLVFKQTGQLPDGFNAEWVALVRSAHEAGKSMQRLRLLSSPLTAYEKFELRAYEGAIRAGHEIRFTPRDSHMPTQDFWLFDDEWIAWMSYDPDGAWVSATVRKVEPGDKDMLGHWLSIFRTAAPNPTGF